MAINNISLYDAVIANIAAVNNGWPVDTSPTAYAEIANRAVAMANEIDSKIPSINPGPGQAQVHLLGAIIQSILAGRFIVSTEPTDYGDVSSAVAAIFSKFSEKVSSSANMVAGAHVHDDGSGPVIQRAFNVAAVTQNIPLGSPGIYDVTFERAVNLDHTHFEGTFHALPAPAVLTGGVMFVIGGTGSGVSDLTFGRYNVFNNAFEPGDFCFGVWTL